MHIFLNQPNENAPQVLNVEVCVPFEYATLVLCGNYASKPYASKGKTKS